LELQDLFVCHFGDLSGRFSPARQRDAFEDSSELSDVDGDARGPLGNCRGDVENSAIEPLVEQTVARPLAPYQLQSVASLVVEYKNRASMGVELEAVSHEVGDAIK
jgi:hypothetical protein